MKCQDVHAVLAYYDEYTQKNQNPSIEEISLFFYFVCYHKKNVSADLRFSDMIEKLFDKIAAITPVYLFTVIHSLGMYSFEFGLDIPRDY